MSDKRAGRVGANETRAVSSAYVTALQGRLSGRLLTYGPTRMGRQDRFLGGHPCYGLKKKIFC